MDDARIRLGMPVPDTTLASQARQRIADFAALFADHAARKPTCPEADMAGAGFIKAIEQAPFES